MARNFNGTTAKVLTSLGAVPSTLTAFSICAIVNPTTVSRWNNILTLATSADGTVLDMTVTDLNVLTIELGATSKSTVTGIGTGWQYLAVDKPAGVVTAQGHRYVYSTNAWTHTAGSGTLTDPTGTIARPYIGALATTDFFLGDIGIVMLLSRQLSQAEHELMPFSLQAWYAAQAKAGWLLDQAATGQKILDWTGGGANENTLTGTTVSTNSVPVFSYGHQIWLPADDAPAAGGVTYQPAGSLVAGGGLSGADVATFAEAGTISPDTSASGADASTFAETGSVTPDTELSGADASTFAETGALTTRGLVSGADVFTAAETGALIVGALLSGVSTVIAGGVSQKTGSVTTGARVSGADVFTAAETGTLAAGTLTAAGDAHTAARTGSLAVAVVLGGVSTFESGTAPIVTTRFGAPGVADTTSVNPGEATFHAPSPVGTPS